MELQRIGTIQVEGKQLQAMLCIDSDIPNEAMFHWWGGESTPGAALTRIDVAVDGRALSFSPLVLYSTNADGGLILATQKEADDHRFLDYSMTLHSEDSVLVGELTSPSGEKGAVRLQALKGGRYVQPEVCATWGAFKEWASRARQMQNVITYRGHGSSEFKLQTTLSRAGRTRLERYVRDTLQEFRAHAEALLGKRFDLNNAADYSTVLGLAQHHGLPTPLLDWTASPYIAAFFAFADAIENLGTRPNASHVRVYGAAREFVINVSPPVVTVPLVSPYVCALSISPLDNPRLYAQQGQFMVTNFSDVEAYICGLEARVNRTFLVAADIPITCASEALEDLEFMGLTAGTMFRGLDGICRMMRHRMIFKRAALPPAGQPVGDVTRNTPQDHLNQPASSSEDATS